MYNETNFPKTHDLLILLGLCFGLDNKFKDFDLSDFASFGVEIRYEEISPTMEETENAFKTAKTIKDYIKDSIRK